MLKSVLLPNSCLKFHIRCKCWRNFYVNIKQLQKCFPSLDGQVPEWRDAPCGGEYVPSTNVPPTAYTPIIVRGDKVNLVNVQNLDFRRPDKWKSGFICIKRSSFFVCLFRISYCTWWDFSFGSVRNPDLSRFQILLYTQTSMYNSLMCRDRLAQW